MSDFTDEYERQMLASMNKLHDVLFPPAAVAEFERTSQADIESGRNLCPCGAKTMERIYPVGHHFSNGWVCPTHAQSMWTKGILRFCTIFNFDDPRSPVSGRLAPMEKPHDR